MKKSLSLDTEKAKENAGKTHAPGTLAAESRRHAQTNFYSYIVAGIRKTVALTVGVNGQTDTSCVGNGHRGNGDFNIMDMFSQNYDA